jgi:hypothetical protein
LSVLSGDFVPLMKRLAMTCRYRVKFAAFQAESGIKSGHFGAECCYAADVQTLTSSRHVPL